MLCNAVKYGALSEGAAFKGGLSAYRTYIRKAA